jgi:oligopeptide transport system permease protein
MTKYILKRVLYMIITLFIIATLTFLLVHLIPGDPIGTRAKVLPQEVQDRIRAKYKWNEPLYVQYGLYLSNLVRGDMGVSVIYQGRSVNDMIAMEFQVSARLGIQAVLVGLIIGLILGIIAAFKRSRWPDYLVIIIAIVGTSIPNFVLALLLQTFIGGKFGVPIVGWPSGTSWLSGMQYTLLPTIALSFGGIASNARYMRTCVLDVINQDYILTARSKGVAKAPLVWKHIMRNAMIPVVTLLGPRIAGIITGTLVIEQIFAIPGLGRELFAAIGNRDYPVVLSLTVFFALLYVLSLLLVDISYVLIDPRIRLTTNKR